MRMGAQKRKHVAVTVGILAAVILAFVGAVFMFMRPGERSLLGVGAPSSSRAGDALQGAAADATLGGDIFTKVQNPAAGAIPETNPFVGTDTNPLVGVYRNPFE